MPGDLMVFMDNGEVLCPDCYEKLSMTSDPRGDATFSSAIDYALRKLEFIQNLPPELASKFIGSIKAGIDPLSDRGLMLQTSGLKIRNFNALVVKTANTELSSICCMGIVFVRDGKVVDRYHSMIKPEPDYYQWHCQSVPWMNEEITGNVPAFRKSWNKIRNKLKGDVPFVAYNA